jgi:hypothetical protein
MLERLRPLAALSATLFAMAAMPAMAASQAPGRGVHPGPHIISVPSHVHGARHHHGHGHRFHRGLFLGGDGTSVVPVPVDGGDEVGPTGAPIIIDAAPRNRPSPNLGPQIITIPESMRPRYTRRRAEHASRWRHASFAPRHRWRAHFGHVWPRGAYRLSPVALHPCARSYFPPIYNTPCGLPYDD